MYLTRRSSNYWLLATGYWLAAFIVGYWLLAIGSAHAASSTLSVSPVVIDAKAMPRDVVTGSATITNTSGRRLNLYTFVYNVESASGRREFLDPSRADFSSSLANWIVISRGVIELNPGDEKKIDFHIEINSRAKPGIYHAVIVFSEGSAYPGAEENAPYSTSVLTVNLEVEENIKERLQLKKFIPARTFFTGFPVSFLYDIENIGNRALSPRGEIRIYDRSGEEVAVLAVNHEEANFASEEMKTLASVWESGRGFGRYKAVLNAEYGTKQRATIQDTVFFWVVPWQFILGFAGLFIFSLASAFMWHKRYEARYFGRLHAEREALMRAEYRGPHKAEQFKVVDLRRNDEEGYSQ